MILTEKLLRNVMKSGRGLKAAQAKILRESWPLRSGWVERVIGTSITDDHYIELLNLRDGIYLKPRKPKKSRHRKRKKPKQQGPTYMLDSLDMPWLAPPR